LQQWSVFNSERFIEVLIRLLGYPAKQKREREYNGKCLVSHDYYLVGRQPPGIPPTNHKLILRSKQGDIEKECPPWPDLPSSHESQRKKKRPQEREPKAVCDA
jgi:hypothetical protein